MEAGTSLSWIYAKIMIILVKHQLNCLECLVLVRPDDAGEEDEDDGEEADSDGAHIEGQCQS